MKTNEINIRDPFVLPHNGRYYMVGTRAETCWTFADGFDGYVSEDLEEWDGPFSLFDKAGDFTADMNYWAPEIHEYKGSFYLFATFGHSDTSLKGTWILKSKTASPLGPYQVHSDGQITPAEWNSLDGTFYLSKEGRPYMVFCHEWQDLKDGEICLVELKDDLKMSVGHVRTLFAASSAKPLIEPIRHERYPGDNYVTDGPFMYRLDDERLIMLWSSFSKEGYCVAVSRSGNGEIDGSWTCDKEPLFSKDGGHGMLFESFDKRLMLSLHKPNIHLEERPVFIDVTDRLTTKG